RARDGQASRLFPKGLHLFHRLQVLFRGGSIDLELAEYVLEPLLAGIEDFDAFIFRFLVESSACEVMEAVEWIDSARTKTTWNKSRGERHLIVEHVASPDSLDLLALLGTRLVCQ